MPFTKKHTKLLNLNQKVKIFLHETFLMSSSVKKITQKIMNATQDEIIQKCKVRLGYNKC